MWSGCRGCSVADVVPMWCQSVGVVWLAIGHGLAVHWAQVHRGWCGGLVSDTSTNSATSAGVSVVLANSFGLTWCRGLMYLICAHIYDVTPYMSRLICAHIFASCSTVSFLMFPLDKFSSVTYGAVMDTFSISRACACLLAFLNVDAVILFVKCALCGELDSCPILRMVSESMQDESTGEEHDDQRNAGPDR